MKIESNTPTIHALRTNVEKRFGKALKVHSDFLNLVTEIENTLREHISETTLERVWGYSTRGYSTVSLRTLDVLAAYATGMNWEAFCKELKQEDYRESDFFDSKAIFTDELTFGDRIRIAWQPDRVAVIRYIGDDRFIAEHCENCTMQKGDTFKCTSFYLGRELRMNNFCHIVGDEETLYIVGQRNGLTTLKKL